MFREGMLLERSEVFLTMIGLFLCSCNSSETNLFPQVEFRFAGSKIDWRMPQIRDAKLKGVRKMEDLRISESQLLGSLLLRDRLITSLSRNIILSSYAKDVNGIYHVYTNTMLIMHLNVTYNRNVDLHHTSFL